MEDAVQRLRSGGILGHAAEGVWGLACDPHNQETVERVLALKSRTAAKGLVLIGGDVEMFAPWLEKLPVENMAMLRASWPGTTTWIVPDTDSPTWIRGNHDSLAIRVPGCAQLRQLSLAFGMPLVSTSANISGKPAARSLSEVKNYFGKKLDGILTADDDNDARLSGQASVIKDALTLTVLRH